MNSHSRVISHSVVALVLLTCTAKLFAARHASVIPGTAQITVLYDAFGKTPGVQKDWGYSALIEFAGKRILFDTGNNPEILEKNAKAKGSHLSKLDFVVMSHRDGDHMGGLPYYGNPPEIVRFGSAWPAANFQLVDKNTEIAPDIHLITLVSNKPGTLELRELSLAINTPEGMVTVVGCSHPGVDKIVGAAATIKPRIRLVAGGLHLVVTSDEDIAKIVTALHDTFRVEYVAPGHCTGEPAFTALRKAFGDRYLYAGLGTTLELPHTPK